MTSKALGWTRCLLALGVITTSLAAAHTSRADDAPAIADEQTMAEARKHFQAGVNLLDDPDGARYEEAYQAFHKAFALSKSPKVLGNIGFCSLKLERDGEAIDAYTTYLRESRDVDPRERAQIERDLATLTSTVATFKVTVRSSADSFVVVDTRVQTRGSAIVNSYPFKGRETTLRLHPGRHTIKVKTADSESLPFEVAIEPGSQSAHEFTFAPPPSVAPTPREAARPSPSYTGPIVLGILGLAAVGTGTVTGLMARSTTNDIEARCPNDVCPKSYDLAGNRSEAKTLGTVADGTFIGGGVALGAALVWAILTPSSSSKTSRTGSGRWQPEALCSARGCSVRIGGAF